MLFRSAFSKSSKQGPPAREKVPTVPRPHFAPVGRPFSPVFVDSLTQRASLPHLSQTQRVPLTPWVFGIIGATDGHGCTDPAGDWCMGSRCPGRDPAGSGILRIRAEGVGEVQEPGVRGCAAVTNQIFLFSKTRNSKTQWVTSSKIPHSQIGRAHV